MSPKISKAIAIGLALSVMACPPALAGELEAIERDADTHLVTLSSLRDLGICLLQIKQQSANIYLEATRKKVPLSANPTVDTPRDLTTKKLDEQADYLPVRPDWLLFYIATMEPIIHLFQEDIKVCDHDTAELNIPEPEKDRSDKLFERYKAGVDELNTHLDRINKLVETSDNNLELARQATAMYKIAEDLEKVRLEFFELVKGLKKNQPS
ncbi:MAG: hypothetical protein AB7W16_15250 [Candidatus Obscuribacterales bacterium]